MRVRGPFTTKEDGKRDYRVSDDNKPWRDELGYWPETLRLCCSDDDVEVVLVKRPNPINRDWKEDSFNHTAFSATKEDFDLFLEKAKEWRVNFHLGLLAERALERSISSTLTATISRWMIGRKRKRCSAVQKVSFV